MTQSLLHRSGPCNADLFVPPSDIDTCVRFVPLRCVLSILSLVLVATDIPRTGLGVRSLATHFTQVAPNTYVYFGPWAYPIAHIYKQDAPSAAPSTTQFTGTRDGNAIEHVALWRYKFDTLSIPTRALAEHLNVSTYPPCVLYREPCSSDTLHLATVFAMNDALVAALRLRGLQQQQQSHDQPSQLTFTTTSVWIDRLHHYLFKPLSRHTEQRIHSVQYYPPTSTLLRTNSTTICAPTPSRRSRLAVCDHLIHWRCDHPTLGADVQVPLGEHVALRLRALQQRHPLLVFDAVIVLSRTVLEQRKWRLSSWFVLPSIYFITDNVELTTLLRGRHCTPNTASFSTPSHARNACETALVDEYRYERASVRTDSDAWYSMTTFLRSVGQGYIWARLLCLCVGCYCARAAEPKFHAATRRQRIAGCVQTLAKIPSDVVVYGSWVPVLCYAAAHAIDGAIVYMSNEAIWTVTNSVLDISIVQIIAVASTQMRNIWFAALFLKLSIAVSCIVRPERCGAQRWTPVHGLVRVRGVLLGCVSALTVLMPLRIRALRDVSILRMDVLSHSHHHSRIDERVNAASGLRNPSEYGALFDLKLLLLAVGMIVCAATAVASVSASLVAPTARIALSCRSYLVPLSVDTFWPRDALVTYWRMRPTTRSWLHRRVLPASSSFSSDSTSALTTLDTSSCDAAANSPVAPALRHCMPPRNEWNCRCCETRTHWHTVQGCPSYDNLVRLEQRTIEHASIVRLVNIAMLTDPLVLVRLFGPTGKRVFVYCVTLPHCEVAASSSSASSTCQTWRLHVLPCPLSDIQDCLDVDFASTYEDLVTRWQLVAIRRSTSLSWSALVDCG